MIGFMDVVSAMEIDWAAIDFLLLFQVVIFCGKELSKKGPGLVYMVLLSPFFAGIVIHARGAYAVIGGLKDLIDGVGNMTDE